MALGRSNAAPIRDKLFLRADQTEGPKDIGRSFITPAPVESVPDLVSQGGLRQKDGGDAWKLSTSAGHRNARSFVKHTAQWYPLFPGFLGRAIIMHEVRREPLVRWRSSPVEIQSIRGASLKDYCPHDRHIGCGSESPLPACRDRACAAIVVLSKEQT